MIPIARTMGARAQQELQRLREQEQVNLQVKRQEQREDTLNFWNMQMKQRQMDQAARESSQNHQLKMAEMQGKFAGATGQEMPLEALRGMSPMAGMGYITGQMQGHQDKLAREERERLAAQKRQREVDWHNMRMMKGGQDYVESEQLHPSRRAISEGRAQTLPIFNQLSQINMQISQKQRELREHNKFYSADAYDAVAGEIRELQGRQQALLQQARAAGAVFGGAPSAGPMGAGGDPDSPW